LAFHKTAPKQLDGTRRHVIEGAHDQGGDFIFLANPLFADFAVAEVTPVEMAFTLIEGVQHRVTSLFEQGQMMAFSLVIYQQKESSPASSTSAQAVTGSARTTPRSSSRRTNMLKLRDTVPRRHTSQVVR